MATIITTEFGVQRAQAFKDALTRTSPAPSYLYMFIGRSSPWDSNDTTPTPYDNDATKQDARDNMIALKRVSSSNVVNVCPRIDWVSGTVYDEYSASDTSLYTKDFYVLTNDYNVYKCLDNNSGGQSTNKPTGTSGSSFTTADGYEWIFVCNLTNTDITNFLTEDWIPLPSTTTILNQLGGRYVMIATTFSDSEGGNIPINDDFRQFGLILNPKLNDTSAATANIYTANDSDSTIDVDTGEILYLDNRQPIVRAQDQNENNRIVIKF